MMELWPLDNVGRAQVGGRKRQNTGGDSFDHIRLMGWYKLPELTQSRNQALFQMTSPTSMCGGVQGAAPSSIMSLGTLTLLPGL